MGSAITSTIVNTTPMFSTALAMLVLGERPGPLVLAAVALIVGGLAIISWEGAERSWKRTELVFPFLAALLFAMKDVTVRWGLGGSWFAGLGRRHRRFHINHRNIFDQPLHHKEKFALPPKHVIHWFVGSGLFTGGSFLFMYLAFNMERVSIVAPLVE